MAETKMLLVRLPGALRRALRAQARRRGLSLNAYAVAILQAAHDAAATVTKEEHGQ